jgi:hypothetical protein
VLPPLVVEPPLDRQGLLLAVMRAGSQFVLGRDDPEWQRQLGGRRFQVALRFGCPGDEMPTRQWTFDEETRVLRLSVEPDLTTQAPAVAELGFEQFEAVEGFWLNRPWLLEPGCPALPAEAASDDAEEDEGENDPSEPQVAAPPRVGLAHFFTAQDSRAQRRERRGYQTTQRLSQEQRPSAEGYDLALSGRLERLPDGRAIACTSASAEAPPTCIVSVRIDHVAFRRPDGALIAEWSRG